MPAEIFYALMLMAGGTAPGRDLIKLSLLTPGHHAYRFWQMYSDDENRPNWKSMNVTDLRTWGEPLIDAKTDEELIEIIGRAKFVLNNGDKVIAIPLLKNATTAPYITTVLDTLRTGGHNQAFIDCGHTLDGDGNIVLMTAQGARDQIALLVGD